MAQNFSDLKISDAITVLSEIGDTESAFELDNLLKEDSSNAELTLESIPELKFNKAWKIKEHAFGYLDYQNRVDNKIPIVNALTMAPDETLKGERINIRVGTINIYRYPGILGGEHEILFEFSAKHSPDDNSGDEDIKYTQKYTIRNKGGGGKQGLKVLQGLRVPNNGIDFYLNTIYIANKSEEKVLKFLNSPIFNSGIELISAANPLVKEVAGYATGITEYITEEKKNKIIQEIGLGFDFSGTTGVASLKKGSYLAVQTKKEDLNWSEWYYDTEDSLIKPENGSGERLPRNFISFIISKYEEE
ncbi:hypothetical protein [Aquimarina algiphila]|uniref:hypothetical protein n=1 Tax=Aquimarina algiphila TaxID=2047982 RepID=UPI00232DDBF9|nr:hypothetical protein [Aquimarina algiphila]